MASAGTPGWPAPQARAGVVAVAVLALHLGVLLFWRLGGPAPERVATAATRIDLVAASAERPPEPDARPHVPADARAPRLPVRPIAAPSKAPAAPPPLAPSAEPAATTFTASPAPADEAASEPLLGNEATRRAILEAARNPGLGQRSSDVLGNVPRDADATLREGVSRSAHGDCAKGEYVGGGMGLLSLPFWAAAELRGKCSR